MSESGMKRYFSFLKWTWTPLPVGIGIAVIAIVHINHLRKRKFVGQRKELCECLVTDWEIQAYKLLPLRLLSRTLGWMTGLELPRWSRNTVHGFYIRTFGCNMTEAAVQDLMKYRSISELFRRKLKHGVRPVDGVASVVSPVDGTILSFGQAKCGMAEQIKGVKYSFRQLLGPNYWRTGGPSVVDDNDDDECYHHNCLTSDNTELFYSAIYLAPGDYHRFHSPSDWVVYFRRHFSGELFSVNPSIISWVKDLFVLNERVVYVGKWHHGFFSFTAVGATNVGSIRIFFDDALQTNRGRFIKGNFTDCYFKKDIRMSKGADFGEFNFGSTVILLFEAPKGTTCILKAGQKIQMGQPMFYIPSTFAGNTFTSRHDEFKQR